jgi:hypothetical protein
MIKTFQESDRELVSNPELISTCLTQKEAISLYNSLGTSYPWCLVNNWRKYDNFILSWVTFKDKDFCNDCLCLNYSLDRMFPQTCLKHYKFGYGYYSILWDESLYKGKPKDGEVLLNSIELSSIELYNKSTEERTKKRKDAWDAYDVFVLEWCIEYPQQDFCYECSCLNNNPQVDQLVVICMKIKHCFGLEIVTLMLFQIYRHGIESAIRRLNVMMSLIN